MEQRLRFMLAWRDAEEPIRHLCERFGVSPKTAYKWIARYRQGGAAALADRPRARLDPAQIDPAVRDAILALRQQRPHWGPRKLRAVLAERHPDLLWPAPSSIGGLLHRSGLVAPRQTRRRTPPHARPLAHASAPNDVWCADYKGWVLSGDGRRCEPLTVTDAHSRFLLAADLVERTDTGCARPVFERLFALHGLPLALRTDNGAPFAGAGAGGLSALSVWWLKLGIRPERIQPGRPQQNGRHERLHRTMLEAMAPPAESWDAQQARLDGFRDDYNRERPHEALGQVPPGRVYRSSHRVYDGRLAEPEYGREQDVRRVRSNGQIKWGGRLVYLGLALVGEPVGLSETEDGATAVHYFDVLLGHLERGANKLRRPDRGHAPDPG
jgi:transposase InsO family protein